MNAEEYEYPGDWPCCPACGRPALDGHITCGRAECNEAEQRGIKAQPYGVWIRQSIYEQ
jgi:hypothetical protein